MARICLITTGQPSSNPRVVKEADALADAGHHVRVISAYWADWADAADRRWVGTRPWSCEYVGGHPRSQRPGYLRTRLRHGISKFAVRHLRSSILIDALAHRALSRTTPELISAACRKKADLYIAHNLGALPAAVIAARNYAAVAGFDAEDLHGQERSSTNAECAEERINRQVEERLIGQCRYLSASTPEISDAYAARYGFEPPLSLLNVFPLRQQPAHRIGKKSESLRLYWFSQTIGRHRGLEDVVRAMGRNNANGYELHLQGVWQPGYQEFICKLASECGVRKEAIVSHGPGLPDDMPRLASEFDVGLSLEQPLSENRNLCLSNKIFTYLLAGNAIVATNTVAQSRLAKSISEAVKVYPPGDIDGLASILDMWRNDRASLEKFRLNAWRAGHEQYNWDSEKKKFLERIGSILLH